MDPTRVTRPAVAGPAGPPAAAGRLAAAGVDVVDVERLGLALRRSGPALERRICTAAEHAALPADPGDRLLGLAAVFGAKESVIKALGGIAEGGRFGDIDTTGPGPVALSGATAAQAGRLGVELVTGSSTTSPATVLAWAIAVPAVEAP